MESTPLAAVVGANLQELRTAHGLTTDEIAKAARLFGLRWTDSRVSAMERGKVAATFATLVALTQALESALGEAVPLSRLVKHDGFVLLNDDLAVRGDALSRFVATTPVTLEIDDVLGAREDLDRLMTGPHDWSWVDYADEGTTNGQLRRILRSQGETEDRVARDLGIDTMRLVVESSNLWGRAFSEERDARAGAEANAQKRGRVARDLKAELRARLANGDDQ